MFFGAMGPILHRYVVEPDKGGVDEEDNLDWNRVATRGI